MNAIKPPWEMAPNELPERNKPVPIDPSLPKKKLHSQSKERIARRTEENLTPRMKDRRDRFIAEYLFDFNGPLAIIRAGGATSTAPKIASQYLHEPYVAKKIRACIEALEEAEIINRKRVLAGLVREAHYQGIGASHSARVAAYAKLAQILGMDAPLKIDARVKFAGGVMLVPMPQNTEDWEKMAEQKQIELKNDVRK